MNHKSTWNWIFLALVLFLFIFFYERHVRKPAPGPLNVLPEFVAANVTSVQVKPAGLLIIRADLTNAVWQLTQPVNYPAQSLAVESLLVSLQELLPATYITARELRERPNFDKEYGFDDPRFSISMEHEGNTTQILIGSLTSPGDQLFLQVVGVEGVYVVDANLLRFLPRSGDDWRDTSLVDLKNLAFDQINIFDGELTITFQLNPTNKAWTMSQPLQSRADNARLLGALEMLQTLRVKRFVTDDPKAELEAFGLQPPQLELSLKNGTNPVAILQFGKATTNDAALIYARRGGVDSVVIVAAEPVSPWRARVEEFRDHRFVSYGHEIAGFEFRGENAFDIQRSSNSWKIVQESFPVDLGLMNDFVTTLGGMQITQFKDAVTGPDLETYGLANPSRTITLLPARASGSLQLSFGSVVDDTVYARRSDEDSVYSVKLGEVLQLPSAAWQLRERRFWNFSGDDVERLIVRQDGKTRELIRHGTNSWSFAPGSQGIINEFAVEEAVYRLTELTATHWVARGDEFRSQYGIGTNGFSLTLELKNGTKQMVEFGSTSASRYTYAASIIEGETWIYEFPFGLHQLVMSYLAIPTANP